MEAAWPAPPRDGATIWHLADTHIDTSGGITPGWSLPRAKEAALDIETTPLIGNIHCKLHAGDIVNNQNDVSSVVDGKAFLDQHLGAVTDVWVPGNHDYRSGITRAEWEVTFGRPGNTSTLIGPPGSQIRVIGITADDETSEPGEGQDIWLIPPHTMTWLAEEIEGSNEPVWLACHYMLAEQRGFTSEHMVQPHDEIVDLISDYPSIIGYLSGHTHFAVTSPRAVMGLEIGNRAAMPCVSAPSTAFTAGFERNEGGRHPYMSTFITYVAADRIEVRYRDHGARQWAYGEDRERVTILTPS